MNRLLQGDCLELLQDIPDNSVDLIVTSPPYDNLRSYKGASNEFKFEPTALELWRITKQGGGRFRRVSIHSGVGCADDADLPESGWRAFSNSGDGAG